VGTILVTGYLGGATATHVRVGDPFAMPILIGVIAWIAIGLRKSKVFRLSIGANSAPPAPNTHTRATTDASTTS
jgi:hypothetical protein